VPKILKPFLFFKNRKKKNPINKSLYEHEKKALSTHKRETTGLGNSSNCVLDDLCKLVSLENYRVRVLMCRFLW
jgi:hypothetical protein